MQATAKEYENMATKTEMKHYKLNGTDVNDNEVIIYFDAKDDYAAGKIAARTSFILKTWTIYALDGAKETWKGNTNDGVYFGKKR